MKVTIVVLADTGAGKARGLLGNSGDHVRKTFE